MLVRLEPSDRPERLLPLTPNLRGALFMVIAMAAFTVNDAITKFSSESMSMAQVMLVRGVFATLLVGLLAWRSGALAQPRRPADQQTVAQPLRRMAGQHAVEGALLPGREAGCAHRDTSRWMFRR